MRRLLIVSNRLPITARAEGDDIKLIPAGGGLANGLRPWHERSGGLWIGWPGDVSQLTEAQRAAVDQQLRGRGIVPVHLSSQHVDRFYHGFANRVLWPLFHYLIDRVPVDAAGWDAYREVNERFADIVAAEHRAGDTIWVHDYQLMLLPALLRERLPDAHIGFFLHIPFPSSEVFRILPWRREILHGLLGADLLGFHTFAYLRHFVATLLHVEGLEADIDRVKLVDRELKLGVFPMGIDAVRFSALAIDPEVQEELATIRREAGGRKILVGIDRLDYTKGLPRRLKAVERFLECHPDQADAIRYIQVAIPSRGEVDSYQKFKRQVEESVGRINGAQGTLRSAPVHYIQRSLSPNELVALYLAADVMLVTPLRDGMNLVAKEFAATRVDEDGVLVLSEFAGAASELDGAVIVNPYDVDAVAASIQQALSMPQPERRGRMRLMRRRVFEYDVHTWANAFLDELDAARRVEPRPAVVQPTLSVHAVLSSARASTDLHLLLDYDGTLVPLARSPELAAPDDEVRQLLEELTACGEIGVEIVSGRTRESLDEWFRDLPAGLWAEHGFWHRPAAGSAWHAAMPVDPTWADSLLPILQDFTNRTPGSRIESKAAGIAWHFRGAEREFGERQAHELRMLLGDALSNKPLEVLGGKKVIEVRLRGISKAVVAQRLPPEAAGRLIVAFGDDRTDEDLFRALPPSSITVAVGQPLIGARYRVDGYRAVRQILRSLLRARRSHADRLAATGTGE